MHTHSMHERSRSELVRRLYAPVLLGALCFGLTSCSPDRGDVAHEQDAASPATALDAGTSDGVSPVPHTDAGADAAQPPPATAVDAGEGEDTTPDASRPATEVRIISHNLYGWNALVQNPWKGENIAAFLRAEQPDFVGAQETEGRAGWVAEQMGENYALAGGEEHGVAIFYRTDRWVAGPMGTVLLEQMDQWGQRVAKWALFRHLETGAEFTLYDTHWCVCAGADLRKSAERIALHVAGRERPELPVVLTGDFNVFEGFEQSPALRYLTGSAPEPFVDTFRIAEPSAPGATFGAAGKIDYILTTAGPTVLGARIERTAIPDGQGSDHYPVLATLAL